MAICIYCGAAGTTPDAAQVFDHESWHDLAREHHRGCEWIATRAHQLDGYPVSVTEIAALAGTTPGTVHSWRRRHADFPAPLAELAIGPVWHWSDVAAWLARPRKPGRPRKG